MVDISNIPKLIFRADGSPKIGLGHIMRCLAIAEMLRGMFKISFAIQNPSPSILKLLQQESISIINLPETFNYNIDRENFIKHLTNQEIIILDGYSFESSYQLSLKKHCRKLIAIDDLVEWHQYADVVINHNSNIKATDYQAEKYTKFLIGTQYALLRQVFLNAHSGTYTLNSNPIKNIFVNLGGADPDNVTYRVVEDLINISPELKIIAVLGSANMFREKFSLFDNSNIKLHQNLTADKLVHLIRDSDIAIVSCSTISYEVATLKKPFIGIVTAKNQISLCDFYKKEKIALDVLEKNYIGSELKNALNKSELYINETLRKQERFFDGKSGERIASFFKTLS